MLKGHFIIVSKNHILAWVFSYTFAALFRTPLLQRTSASGFGKGKIEKQLPEVFCKKGFLKNFTKFTGKHLHKSHRFK